MTTDQAPTAPPEPSEDSLSLVKQGIAQVTSGKITLSDLLQAVMAPADKAVETKKPPTPPALTEQQVEALRRIPEIYGSVIVEADRALTPKERKALVEEREIIDEVIGVLEKRKSDSIREVLANDLDHLVPPEERGATRLDKRGHFAVKQEIAVPGTGKKIARSVSGGKPKLTIEAIEALHAQGRLDRKTYLAITKTPENPRVLDEAGLHKAIQKDPRLFFLLGSVAEPTTPTTAITVVDDK